MQNINLLLKAKMCITHILFIEHEFAIKYRVELKYATAHTFKILIRML